MRLDRRLLLLASGALVVAGRAAAHTMGPVKPAVAVPKISFTGADGKVAELAPLLKGKITGLQLMFTRCTAMCPIQGAIFGDTQKQLAKDPAAFQLLSLSIDAKGDTAKSMAAWLKKMNAEATRWNGGVFVAADLDPMLDFVRGRADGVDSHTAQVYLFNRNAEFVYRTAEMPTATEVVSAMRQVATAT